MKGNVFISPEDIFSLNKISINEKDILDDGYDYSGVIVQKPWGYEYLLFSNKNVAVWVLFIKKDFETSNHCHPNKTTTLIVLNGSGVCTTFSGAVNLECGEGLRIHSGVFHSTKAVSKEGAYLIEIETPVNKRDLVRLNDKYGRAGMGYEGEQHYLFNTHNFNYLQFNSRDVPYSFQKLFERSSLKFHKNRGNFSFLDMDANESNDLIVLLAGEITDLNGQSLVSIGDGARFNYLRLKEAKLSKGSEILIISNAPPKKIKITDSIAGFLHSKFIRTVFMVPGEANMHLMDSMGKYDGLNCIILHSEKSASLAAEAYTKMGGQISAVIVSSGAAVINAIQGVANSWIDSIPMIVISGQDSSKVDTLLGLRQEGNKSINTLDLVTGITKFSQKVTDPYLVRKTLLEGYKEATKNRMGPVWIDIPIDIQGVEVENSEAYEDFDVLDLAVGINYPSEFFDRFDSVIDSVLLSQRPVLLIGQGVKRSGVGFELLRFIDLLQIPVLTSRSGADLIDDQAPLFFGRPGPYGQRAANLIIQNCDLLLIIGDKLSTSLTGRNQNEFAKNANIIIVNNDLADIFRVTRRKFMDLNCDAKFFIQELSKRIAFPLNSKVSWIRQCTSYKKKYPSDTYSNKLFQSNLKPNEEIFPLHFISTLSAIMDSEDTLIADGGAPLVYLQQGFKFKLGQKFVISSAMDVAGFAIAGAIGASFAGNMGRIICIMDDRGFYNGFQDLLTIIRCKLKIKIVVLSGNGLKMLRLVQKDYFGSRFIGTNEDSYAYGMSICEIATSFGISYLRISCYQDLNSKLKNWLNSDDLSITEIGLRDDQDYLSRPNFSIDESGVWTAFPLDSMHPPI